MIEKDKIMELIKSQLPQAENETVEEIAVSIIQDVEAIVHSMVRQAVSQEREHLYRRNNKD